MRLHRHPIQVARRQVHVILFGAHSLLNRDMLPRNGFQVHRNHQQVEKWHNPHTPQGTPSMRSVNHQAAGCCLDRRMTPGKTWPAYRNHPKVESRLSRKRELKRDVPAQRMDRRVNIWAYHHQTQGKRLWQERVSSIKVVPCQAFTQKKMPIFGFFCLHIP